MKTIQVLFARAEHTIGVTLSILLALVPSILYGLLWWHISKTFWPVFFTAIAFPVWLFVQLVVVLQILLWWETPPESADKEITHSEVLAR